MDEATWFAVAFLTVATVAVTLSNFYGGLIAAVITPIAIGVYWFARARFAPHAPRRLGVTVGTLACLALAGLAFVWWTAPGVMSDRAALAFTREDLFRYSAKWWGYLVPPVAHPLLGGLARRIWIASRVNEGLLEQQVSLGWSVVALGSIAIWGWSARRSSNAVGTDACGHRDRRAGLLALARTDHPRRHGHATVGAALSHRPDVPVVRAVRRHRAAHGGAAGRDRRGAAAGVRTRPARALCGVLALPGDR